jgi:hypothetical protein
MDVKQLITISHAVISVGLVSLGLLALITRKSRHSPHPRIGEAYFWVLVVALGSGLLVGAQNPGISVFEIATPPTLLFGLLGYVMVKRKPRRWLGRPWLYWHIFGQGGSYIGVVTATSFQTVPRLLELAPPALQPPAPLLVVALFAIPSVTGTLLIRRAQKKWTKGSSRQALADA